MQPNANMLIPAPPSKLADPLAVALGLVNWNCNWGPFSGATAPTSQTVYVQAIWLPFGKPVTKVAFSIVGAASGTAITAGYAGLCSPTTMLAQSNSIGTAAASYPAGPLVVTLNTTYTPSSADSANGLFYVMLLLNGTFGTTQPSFQRGVTSASVGASPSGGSNIAFGTAGTGQATLPANAAAVSLAAGGTAWAVGCA